MTLGVDLPFDVAAVSRSQRAGRIARLGRALRRRGLSVAAMRSALGLEYANRLAIALLPSPPPALAASEALPWLFVAGRSLSHSLAAQALGAVMEPLIELGLLRRCQGRVAATVSICPIGKRLVCCDLPGSPWNRTTVASPDLSAYHVIRALRQRAVESWLDVGTGSGAVLLGGLRLATRAGRLLGTDVNPRALVFAQLGAALSGLSGLSWQRADLFEGLEERRWRVITCNPPLDLGAEEDEMDDELPLFLAGRPGLVEHFWREVRVRIHPEGEVVLHTPLPPDPDYPHSLALPGEVIVRRWKVGDGNVFCTTAWRPSQPRCVRVREVPAASP